MILPALKLAALGAGFFYPYWGSMLMLLDGRFHFSSHETLVKDSPDWIILRYFFNKDGFSVSTHRVIALGIILFTLTFLGLSLADHLKSPPPPLGKVGKGFIKFYRYLFMPITLAIIFTAILLKNIVLGKKGATASF